VVAVDNNAIAPGPEIADKDSPGRVEVGGMDVVFQDSLQLLTVTEARALLNVSSSWLYAAAKDRRIPAVRLGGEDGPIRFIAADLIAHVEEARARWRPGSRPGAPLREVSHGPAARRDGRAG
jgi:excisionase family DNA binding protein